MLVLRRKVGEKLLIGEDIEVVVLEVTGDRVKLGIDAPREVEILRQELLDAVTEENKRASAALPSPDQLRKLRALREKKGEETE